MDAIDPHAAFSVAVTANDTARVRDLLEHPELRARVDDPLRDGPFGRTLLDAVYEHHREMIDLLLDSGANINAKSEWRAGGFGVLDHASDLVPSLIERGATSTSMQRRAPG